MRYYLYCSSSIHPAKMNQIGLEIIWSKQQNNPNVSVAQCSWVFHRYIEMSSTLVLVYFWKLKLNCFSTLSLVLLSTFAVFQFPVITTIPQELWIGTAKGLEIWRSSSPLLKCCGFFVSSQSFSTELLDSLLLLCESLGNTQGRNSQSILNREFILSIQETDPSHLQRVVSQSWQRAGKRSWPSCSSCSKASTLPV